MPGNMARKLAGLIQSGLMFAISVVPASAAASPSASNEALQTSCDLDTGTDGAAFCLLSCDVGDALTVGGASPGIGFAVITCGGGVNACVAAAAPCLNVPNSVVSTAHVGDATTGSCYAVGWKVAVTCWAG